MAPQATLKVVPGGDTEGGTDGFPNRAVCGDAGGAVGGFAGDANRGHRVGEKSEGRKKS